MALPNPASFAMVYSTLLDDSAIQQDVKVLGVEVTTINSYSSMIGDFPFVKKHPLLNALMKDFYAKTVLNNPMFTEIVVKDPDKVVEMFKAQHDKIRQFTSAIVKNKKIEGDERFFVFFFTYVMWFIALTLITKVVYINYRMKDMDNVVELDTAVFEKFNMALSKFYHQLLTNNTAMVWMILASTVGKTTEEKALALNVFVRFLGLMLA